MGSAVRSNNSEGLRHFAIGAGFSVTAVGFMIGQATVRDLQMAYLDGVGYRWSTPVMGDPRKGWPPT